MIKSKLLLLLAVSVLSLSMKAQEKNVFYKKGYAPSIEIGGTFVDSFGFRPEVLTSHGYCFGNGLYVGGGLGLGFEHWTIRERENRFFVPVFVDLKYSFLNRLASPFVGIKAGAMLDCTGLGIGWCCPPLALTFGDFLYHWDFRTILALIMYRLIISMEVVLAILMRQFPV